MSNSKISLTCEVSGRIMEHPFVLKILDGTIDRSTYARYLSMLIHVFCRLDPYVPDKMLRRCSQATRDIHPRREYILGEYKMNADADVVESLAHVYVWYTFLLDKGERVKQCLSEKEWSTFVYDFPADVGSLKQALCEAIDQLSSSEQPRFLKCVREAYATVCKMLTLCIERPLSASSNNISLLDQENHCKKN